MTRMRIWSVGTAVLAVLILLAGWFLLVTPAREKAAGLRTEAAGQETANEQLQSRIAMLKKQAEGLPAQRDKLQEIARRMPAEARIPAFIRTVTSASEASDVDFVSITPAEPAPVTAQAGSTSLPGATAAPSAPSAPASTAAPVSTAGDLYQIPVSLEMAGRFSNLEQFLTKVESFERVLLVTGIDLTEKTEAGQTDVLTMNVTGRIFVLKDAAAASATALAAGSPAASTAATAGSPAAPSPASTSAGAVPTTAGSTTQAQ